jgi:hypothetical protein
MPTVKELRELFKQARVQTGLWVPYWRMRKDNLLDVAHQTGLLINPERARAERLQQNRARGAEERLRTLYKFIQNANMNPTEKQRALNKFAKLFNNWRGTDAQFEKLERYERIMG